MSANGEDRKTAPGYGLRLYWARRRLETFLSAYVAYIGDAPKSVTVRAEDYDLLEHAGELREFATKLNRGTYRNEPRPDGLI